MRILLDQAEHTLRNKGNNAMLQTTMQRFAQFWPEATFDLITIAPNLAHLYYPSINPVDPDNLRPFQSRVDIFRPVIPKFIWRLLFELREESWHRRSGKSPLVDHAALQQYWPSSNSDKNQTDRGNGNQNTENINEAALMKALSCYDMFVATGGGYMCDHDYDALMSLFNRLEAAIGQGVYTILVGQGVGPMENPNLIARAKEVLPEVDLVYYRNERLGRPLLEALNVPPEKIMMTGDDAVELAYNVRQSTLGMGIGVSLRVSSYTQVGQEQLDRIRAALHRAARERNAALISVPISSAIHESDNTYIKQLLAGYPDTSVGWARLDSPLDAIKKASHCRLMITGTYHGAIFSLAQGIPVIGVAKSVEYFNKLSELSDEFGEGCRVILMDEKLAENLQTAIEYLWSSADRLRPNLLEVAVRQVKLQQEGYKRIFKLVTAN